MALPLWRYISVCPQLYLSTHPGPGIQEGLSDPCPSVGEWLYAAVVIFKIHDKQHGYELGSVRHGPREGPAGSWLCWVMGVSRAGEVLGVGAAFSYQPVRKCLNILKTE